LTKGLSSDYLEPKMHLADGSARLHITQGLRSARLRLAPGLATFCLSRFLLTQKPRHPAFGRNAKRRKPWER